MPALEPLEVVGPEDSTTPRARGVGAVAELGAAGGGVYCTTGMGGGGGAVLTTTGAAANALASPPAAPAPFGDGSAP